MADVLEGKRELVRRHPTNELARFSLGKALFDRGEHHEAAEHLRVALERKPDWMVVQILLGKCAWATGDRAGARAAIERARDLAVAQHHEGPLMELEAMLAEMEGAE
ncbi:MAG: tetratricopeptide repeat protein [Verrucomicrobiota bacterium]|jgi:Flp pilus assembly protein TadD